MDRYTKMAHYVMIWSNIDISRLVVIFVWKLILAGLGVSDFIMLDWESVFILTFWSTVYYHLKVCRRLLTAFYLQTNSQIEWQNLTLEWYFWTYITY